jgi:hypothetical protein
MATTRKFKKDEILCIEWKDHCTVDNWETVSKLLLKEPAVCESIGYFLGENKEVIFIAQGSIPDGDSYFNTMMILRNSIMNIKRLK